MPKGNNNGIEVSSYSEAEFANDETSRKSITGMITMANGALVQWLARPQPIVAKSTCEAEYNTTADTTTLTEWLTNIMNETQLITHTLLLHVDNTAAVQMTKKPAPPDDESE